MTSQTGSEVAAPSRKSITMATEIVLLDIRGFSKGSTAEQLAVVETLTDRLRQLVAVLVGVGGIHVPDLQKDPLIVGHVPTGDGAYLVLNPLYAAYGILLAMAIRNDMVLINRKLGGTLYDGVGAAVHLGECAPFLDITGRVNFVGSGLNDCSRILQAHCASKFPLDFTDEDYIVASSEAIACFDDLYYSKTNEGHKRLMQHRRSEPFIVTDKHRGEHSVQLIEMHRNIALQPFKPVVDLSEEQKHLMREIAANRLPELRPSDSIVEDLSGTATSDDLGQTPGAREGVLDG